MSLAVDRTRLYVRGAAEALAEVPDLQVTGATWDEGGQRLHVELKWKGAPLMAEVPL